MRKCFLILLLSCITTYINSQQAFSAKQTTAQQLPKPVKFRGKFIEAWTWKDNLGENILILSQLGPTKRTPGNEYTNVELFANHYCKKDTGYKQIWKMNDLVKDCDFDIEGNFIKGTTSITDLDKDGIAETKVQYRMACRSDVSPCEMKLIMHEDSVKYALRGVMWMPDYVDPKQKMPITEKDVNLEKLPGFHNGDDQWQMIWGRYNNEKDFAKAPPEFLEFARKQWLRFVKDGFE